MALSKTICLCCICQSVNPIQSSGHYTYHEFNIQQSYVLPTQCIYVFCVDIRTNRDGECLLRGKDFIYIYIYIVHNKLWL